jgi:hypothetical protein
MEQEIERKALGVDGDHFSHVTHRLEPEVQNVRLIW